MSKKYNSQVLASWIFGGISFIFLLVLFVFGPPELPYYKKLILANICSLLSGLFAFFLTGTINLLSESDLPEGGKLTIRATGGLALFLIVFFSWQYDLRKEFEKEQKYVESIVKKDHEKIIADLEEKLKSIPFIQTKVEIKKPLTDEEQAEYEQLVTNYDELKQQAQKRYNKVFVFSAASQVSHASALSRLGKYQEAKTASQTIVDKYPENTDAMNGLGLILFEQAEYKEAEILFRKALAKDEATFGPDHLNVARDLNHLAGILSKTNRLAEAEPMYRRALEIHEKMLGPNNPKVAVYLNNLGNLLKEIGRFDEAESMYRKVIKINEASFEPNQPDVASSLNNLAELLRETNRLDEAEPMYRRALKNFKVSYGPDHPKVATILNNLGALLIETDCLDEADSKLRRALKIDEASFGSNHPNVARDLNNLAILFKKTGRFDEAESKYRRTLKIDEEMFGLDHPKVARDLNNLANVLKETNHLDEAELMYQRALKIFEDSYEPDHPSIKAARKNLEALKKNR